VSEKTFFKSENIWQSYKKERDCLVHCYQMKKVHETITFLLVTLPVFSNLKIITDRLSNKSFLIWLLATPPHLKYDATLPCNLSLIACFLTLMFNNVMWQHMQIVVGFLTITLMQIWQGILR